MQKTGLRHQCHQRHARCCILRNADRSTFRKEKTIASVTLSSKFQLSIPKAIREEMHLQAGQKFAIIPKGDAIVLVPIRRLAEMRGIL